MARRMLIDTTHAEETRVVVVSGDKVEDFDYETANKALLKGNIYLAKVTRVEPSLQAAFVDYGGNRHGFLPFSEIHPDYYRIPVADREALLAEEYKLRSEARGQEDNGEEDVLETALDRAEGQEVPDEPNGETGARSRGNGADSGKTEADEQDKEAAGGDGPLEEIPAESSVDTLGGDELEEAARRRARLLGRYKIQEVVKRRQVMLVQVTKEERGTKGAALTTYLSLAGRYCVLMPNTAKGGGISRKIGSATDRRRLKTVLASLDIPEGMAVIVRTAGSQRTKAEIRRDYEYLLRLWDEIRTRTLESTAPSLIYEEASLIKRAIRDLYSRVMDEVTVEGEEGYKAAKAFMKTLMPSHARKVKLYSDADVPLFNRHRIESQLDAMYSPSVQLRSGGSIVLNPTEALVAIDVNSGKATKERHIERTALKTNIEAAEEVARQLRLRDLAGLIVIDFIDMEETRNNREVERRLKEAMKNDRARIQLGRISPFGLLELSRQRLRPSVMESASVACTACQGTGFVRSAESASLQVLRAITEAGIAVRGGGVELSVPTGVALYLLNEKRKHLQDIESRYGLTVMVRADDGLTAAQFQLQRFGGEAARAQPASEERPREPAVQEAAGGEEEPKRRRGRRGGRRRRKDVEVAAESAAEPIEVAAALNETEAGEPAAGGEEGPDDWRQKRRRRGKRGGRRRGAREEETGGTPSAAPDAATEASVSGDQGVSEVSDQEPGAPAHVAAPPQPDLPESGAPRAEADGGSGEGEPEGRTAPEESAPAEAEAPAPRRRPRRVRQRKVERAEEAPEAVPEPQAPAEEVPVGALAAAAGESEPAAKTSESAPVAPASEPETAAEPLHALEAAEGSRNGGESAEPAVTDAPQMPAGEQAVPTKGKRRGWWNRLLD